MNKPWFKIAYRQHHLHIYRLFNYPPLTLKTGVQTGAGKSKYIKYKGFTFELYTDETDNEYNISVLSTTEQSCIQATVPKPNNKTKVTIVQNITVHENCAIEGLHKTKGGAILVTLMLYYLKQHKAKYNISRVVLSDISYLPCTGCSRSLKLARLRMITHGETWYMKFGFKPYDQDLDKRSDKYNKAIRFNQKVVPTLKTSNIDLNKVIHKAHQEGSKLNIREITRLATKYKSLREFIIRLLSQYDIHCCLVYWILEELYEPDPTRKPILIDIYHKMFYLDI